MERSAHRVSVVMPVLNEEARIARQLESLATTPDLHELIVVDGGSRDRTVELAREGGRARILSAPAGRAAQMNAGARVASGDVLLFLHADVGLPRDAARWISDALDDPEVIAGAFRTWTVIDGGPPYFAAFLHLADLRSRYTSLPYGDQAVFMRTEVFHRAGGFPDQALMEDLELSRRLHSFGRIRTVPASVRVSGRRFAARPIYYAFWVNLFPLLYRLGVPSRLLASLYGDPR